MSRPSIPFPPSTPQRRIREAVAVLLTASFLGGCAVNPRPTFDEARDAVKSRDGLEATWSPSAAEQEASSARVRELLKKPLSPRRAAQIALINNRGLQARLEELGVAQAHLAAASLPGNPEIESFLGWPNESGAPKAFELGFGLDILDLFVLPSRKRLAALELKQAKAIAGDAILETATLAQKETYALQALEANARAIATAVEIEQALTDFAEARQKAGTLSDLAYEEERLHLDELLAKRAWLDLAVQKKREVLNTILGLSDNAAGWTTEPLAADLPSIDPASARFEQTALQQRFDLNAMRSAVEMLEGTLKLQKKTRFLPAGVHAGVRLEKEGSARVTGPSLKLQLPIFNPGRAESSRIEALYFQAQRMLEDREVHARADVRQKVDQLITSQKVVKHFEENVAPRKKRIVEMKKAYYNMMLAGADDLLRARRDEIEAEVPLIEARSSYWIARVELAQAIGGASPDSVITKEKN